MGHEDHSWSGCSVTRIDGGTYRIGSQVIQNAGPSHQRRLTDFWIDAEPVTFAHFEQFVAAGGYHQNRWWADSGQPGRTYINRGSVDARCQQLRQAATNICRQLGNRHAHSAHIPLIGLTWMESAAVCRFFGARLPFEVEWEVAMQESKDSRTRKPFNVSRKCPVSRWGCVYLAGYLREWTADAFSPRYWRADTESHGEFWTSEDQFGVTVRGHSDTDVHTDIRFRRSLSPDTVTEGCGFRRVWLTEPSADKVSAAFREGPR